MARFRKKPVEVEAVQWTGDNEDAVTAFTGRSRFNALDADDREWTAQVFDDLHSTWVGVYTGQWIIRGVKGEFYPCAPDVLARTYEPVEVDASEASAIQRAVDGARANPGQSVEARSEGES